MTAPLRLTREAWAHAWGRYDGMPYAGKGSGRRDIVVATNGLAPHEVVRRPDEPADKVGIVCCTGTASVKDLAAGPRTWRARAWQDLQIVDPSRPWSPLELLAYETGNRILEGAELAAAAKTGIWQLQGWDGPEGHSFDWDGDRGLVVASGWPTGRVGSVSMSWAALTKRWPLLRGVRLDAGS